MSRGIDMEVKLIATTDSPNNPGLKQLRRSLDHFEWDYEILNEKYVAFGSKQVAYYNYMKRHPEYTHLFIVDAHDVFVLGRMEEVLNSLYGEDVDSILLNAEKGLWPYPHKWKHLYPSVDSEWKYVNGGAAFVDTQRYVKMYEDHPIQHTDNDQVNLTELYLHNRDKYNIKLDTDCRIFQSIAFQSPDDFTYNRGRLFNNKTKTAPVIIHGNGKTEMGRIYSLLD